MEEKMMKDNLLTCMLMPQVKREVEEEEEPQVSPEAELRVTTSGRSSID